jgi:hypothetical protein
VPHQRPHTHRRLEHFGRRHEASQAEVGQHRAQRVEPAVGALLRAECAEQRARRCGRTLAQTLLDVAKLEDVVAEANLQIKLKASGAPDKVARADVSALSSHAPELYGRTRVTPTFGAAAAS